MVVHSRIAYIRALVAHGAKVLASVNTHPTTLVQKIKFLIDPSVRIPPEYQDVTLSLLDKLQADASTKHVTDKGHTHKGTGISEVAFWVDGRKAPSQMAGSFSDTVVGYALSGLLRKVKMFQDSHAYLFETDANANNSKSVLVQQQAIDPSPLDMDCYLDGAKAVKDALQRFQKSWSHFRACLEDCSEDGLDRSALRTLDASPHPTLFVHGASNSLLNGHYTCVGFAHGRRAWKSATGILIYFSDLHEQDGWHFGLNLNSQYSLAHHPSISANSPPPNEWDCYIFGNLDGLHIQVAQ